MEDCDQVSGQCGNTIQGRLGENAKGITSWTHQLLGMEQRWAGVLAFQMACQVSLRLWRQVHAVVGSETPSVPRVLHGSGYF